MSQRAKSAFLLRVLATGNPGANRHPAKRPARTAGRSHHDAPGSRLGRRASWLNSRLVQPSVCAPPSTTSPPEGVEATYYRPLAAPNTA